MASWSQNLLCQQFQYGSPSHDRAESSLHATGWRCRCPLVSTYWLLREVFNNFWGLFHERFELKKSFRIVTVVFLTSGQQSPFKNCLRDLICFNRNRTTNLLMCSLKAKYIYPCKSILKVS